MWKSHKNHMRTVVNNRTNETYFFKTQLSYELNNYQPFHK